MPTAYTGLNPRTSHVTLESLSDVESPWGSGILLLTRRNAQQPIGA